MGLLEATRYPEDYDGVIAGAPWLDPLGTSLWSLKNTQALLAGSIPPSLLPAVDASIKKQCDATDGLADGLIQNPAKCSFNPDSLVPGVLTQAQADALKSIFKPVSDDKGNFVYPGSSVSLGLPTNGLVNELATPPANAKSSQPWGETAPPANWNLARGIYDPAVDLNNAVENGGVVKSSTLMMLYDRLGPDIPDDPTKLMSFFRRGGKLLIYHGYDDLIISPYRSIWYYEDLAGKTGGYKKLERQARLFMVPGMQHCIGGPGPNTFDTLSALEKWVEKGVAPDTIVASHSTNDMVDRTMPLCKFPEQARYKGSGEVTDAANWSCPANEKSLVGPNGVQSGLDAPALGSARNRARSLVKTSN
jgi:feruloyl esterase